MKKILFTSALVLTMGAVAASAQDNWEFGLKGGMALNMMPRTTVDDFDKFKPNIGFQAAGYACVELSDLLLAQVELGYTRKGVSTINHSPELIGIESWKYSRNIHYLQIPLFIGFHSFADSKLRVMIGPEFNFCLGNDVHLSYIDPLFESDAYSVRPFNLGVAVQSTYFLTDSFGIEAKFDFGLTRTFVKETQDRGHNAALQIGVCYRFGY